MSRWRPERIRIALHADRAALIRLGGRGRRRITGTQAIAFGSQPHSVEQQGEAIGNALRHPDWRHGAVEIVLSHALCKLALVPGGIAVHGRREEEALHRNCIEEANGELPAGWRIAVAEAPLHRPRLACAVDGALIDALETGIKSSGGKLASLRPLLVDAYNARRAQIGVGYRWLVTAEQDRCCIARIRNGVWESVRVRRLFDSPESELASLLKQESTHAADEAAPTGLLLCAPNHPQLRLPAGIAPVHLNEIAASHHAHAAPAIFGMALEGLQ